MTSSDKLGSDSNGQTQTKTPPPVGARCFIQSGDFGGEVGTVGALTPPQVCADAGRTLCVTFNPPAVFDGVHVLAAFVDPANVQPVPTELEDEPSTYEDVDAFASVIASWLKTTAARTLLAKQELNVGMVLEGIGAEENFKNHMYACIALRNLGFWKEEVVRGEHREFVLKRIGEVPIVSPKKKYEADPTTTQGLAMAITTLIALLLDKAGNVERLASLARLILGTGTDVRYDKLQKFIWVDEITEALQRLRIECETQNVKKYEDVLFTWVVGETLGIGLSRSVEEMIAFHRSVVASLVWGHRLRLQGTSGVDQSEIKSVVERTPQINGWLLALFEMAQHAKELHAQTLQGHPSSATLSNDERLALAKDYKEEAEALEWIVQALGFGPDDGDEIKRPMLDLIEHVDLAVFSETMLAHEGESS